MTKVPQELVEEILSYLHQDDATLDLRLCSLVSSSFRETAQRFIFSTILLDIELPLRQERLLNVFSSNDRLPPHVSYLRIKLSPTTDVDSACGVLRLLHHVRGVSLERGIARSPSWKEIHVQLRDFIRCTMCLPTCETLSLDDRIFFPTTFIRHLTHIRRLKIYKAERSLDYTGDGTNSSDFPLPAAPDRHDGLDSLMLGPVFPSTVPNVLLSCPFVSRIRILHIGPIRQDVLFQEYLNNFPHLETLHFTIALRRASENYIDLSLLRRLRRLRIGLLGSWGKPGPWLIRVLATLPSTLPTLELSVSPHLHTVLTPEDWRQIDLLLDGYRELRCVRWSRTPDLNVEGLLPRLSEKGLLSFLQFQLAPLSHMDSSSYLNWCSGCFPLTRGLRY